MVHDRKVLSALAARTTTVGTTTFPTTWGMANWSASKEETTSGGRSSGS